MLSLIVQGLAKFPNIFQIRHFGGPARLDFTVIGRAVNATSRIEALTKSLKRSILISDPVSRHLDRPLDHLGEHQLCGLTDRSLSMR